MILPTEIRKMSCDFSTAGVFCRRSLQCPGIPGARGVPQPQLPIYYRPFLGFITIGTPFITMASRAHLLGSHSFKGQVNFGRKVLTSGVKDDQ